MTGIFQLFDRYKAKALVKNERRKIDSGEPEIKTIPPYYVVEHDGRKRVPDSSDRRSSEASRDSRRSSSADVSEVVVKTLTPFLKESQTIQNPHPSGRPSVDSPKLTLSPYKSSFSPETPNEFRDSFQYPEIYSSDAATPKPTGPSRSSVDTNRSKRDGRRLPPRSAFKSKERSMITLLDYLKDVPDDAREISRAILQIRESANRSPYGEARRQPPSVLRKEFHSSGDEQDSKYGRRDLSSGDERDGHRHPTAREARRYSSATEQHVYDYELDHHRPQFPIEGKDFLQGRRNQQSSSHHHLREMARYISSGDEMDRRSNMSSGDDTRAYRLHRSHDQESSRSHWPVDRDGRRYHSAGDVFKEDSSGDERVQRPYPRRHQYQGHQKYHASKEGRRRVAYDALGRELPSSGDEMSGHGHMPRRHSSIHYAGYRHGAEANVHQRFQSAGEEYRHQTSSASKASRPSTSGFEGRRYQSSGDERGGHRRVDGRRRHDPPLENNWRNEFSDEDRELFQQLQQQQRRSSIDPRRSSSATDAQRRYSVSNDDGQRHSSSHDDRRRDRSRSSVRNGSKYEPVVETRCDSQNFHSRGDWGYVEANVPGALKESHKRNLSVESKGQHRRRSSNSSVTSNKESLKLHSKPKVKEGGYSRDLPPRSSSGSRNNTVSPRNVVDLRDLARLNVQVRESSQTPALRDVFRAEKSSLTPDLCAESVPGSYDFREMMRAVDFKDAQWNSEKVSARSSFDGRDPPRTSNVSRVSVDSRQYQSSTPRLSVDGREHLRASSLHSSRASSVDARVQMRTNSMDSSSTSGEFKRRGPSVVARLMGLAELPEKGTASQAREGKSLQRLLSSTPPAEASSPPAKTQHHLSEVAQQMKQVQARLHRDSQLSQKTETRPKLKSKAKSRTQSKSRSPPPAPVSQQDKDTQGSLIQHQGYGIYGRQVEPGSPLPRQPMSPKHHQMEGMPKKRPQDFTSGDLDQRLHQLRIKNSIQEHRTLKQILEAMHLKGLLHPPPKKPSKSPRAELNESKEEAERPLQDFESKPSSRVTRNGYQGQLDFEDLIRMDGEVHKVPAIDKDEASIVVMKPLNYHSAIPPAATKEVDMNSESASRSGFSKEKIEIGHRRRGSERRAGSSGKLSRSHSLELPAQTSATKVQVDDLSFANVMLSWRERIAADAVKKATVDVAELKTQSRAKSIALKHRSQDASPSSRNSGSTEKRVASSRVQEIPVEEYTREEYDTASRNVLSDTAQENSDEDRLRVVDRSKSDLQLSAKTVEALAAMDASSLERVPAQVAVLRTKRASGKSSRSKEKLRASYPADPRSNSTAVPSLSTPESSTDEQIQSPSHSLNDSKAMSLGPDANAQKECTSEVADDSSRMTPKKRKIAEPGDLAKSPPKVTLEVGVHGGLSNEVENSTHVGELAPLHCTLVDCSEAEELQDAKMDDAFDDTPEAHTPEGFSSGKCFSDEGAFSLQGADHRSPVSVLDSPIFQEGFHLEELSTSPDSVKSILLRHEDAKDTPELVGAVSCEQESEVPIPRARPSKDTSDPLRDIYTKVARSLELGEKEIHCRQPSIDLRIPSPSVATEAAGDHSQGKLYVQGILTESGLSAAASMLPKDAAEVMEFDVFTRKEEELQTAELERIDRGELEKTEEKRYKESLDRRLIFDCMNEILERKMSPFLNPQPWGAPVVRRKPYGPRLLNEVWDELRDMHWPTSVSDDALYAVLQKDFMRKGFQWLDFSVEVGDVGCELECTILQELVEEIVQEVKNMKPKSSSLELQPSSPASSPRAEEDDSELRRRELLDKTRRDLLAWHVQYQQL